MTDTMVWLDGGTDEDFSGRYLVIDNLESGNHYTPSNYRYNKILKNRRYMLLEGDNWTKYTGDGKPRIDSEFKVWVITRAGYNPSPRRVHNWNWLVTGDDKGDILYYRYAEPETLMRHELDWVDNRQYQVAQHHITYIDKGRIYDLEFKIAEMYGSCGTCALYDVGYTAHGGKSYDFENNDDEANLALLKEAAAQLLHHMKNKQYSVMIVADGNGSYFREYHIKQHGDLSARGLIKALKEYDGRDNSTLEMSANTKNMKTSNRLGVWTYSLNGEYDDEFDW